MIQDITIFIFAASIAFGVLILSGFTVNIIMKRHTALDTAKTKKMSVYGKAAAFALFLVIGFSLVPIMVKLFTDALPEIIKESTFPLTIKENAMNIVYGFWVVYALGIIIALPAMIKDGFFAPEHPEGFPEPTEKKPPAGALPPLEHQINVSVIILLARTEIENGRTVFYPIELWRQEGEANPFVQNNAMVPNIRIFELLGYVPENGQEVVFFFSRQGLTKNDPLELLPVVMGQVTYGPTDQTVTKKLTIAELKKMVVTPKPSR